MSFFEYIKSDIILAGSALGSAGFGNITTDEALQRLAWTLAIVVSLFTIIRFVHRFYQWCKSNQFKRKLNDPDED